MIAIGIPIEGEYIHLKFWESMRRLQLPEITRFITQYGYGIDRARNRIVMQALDDCNCSHILFIDSDVIVPAHLIFELMKNDKDIISGLYFTRKKPYLSTAKNIDSNNRLISIINPKMKVKKVIKCDTTGMGCTLINIKVFKSMKPPWFEFKEVPNINRKEIVTFAEDDWFCLKAKELGFETYVNTSLRCGHIATKIIGAENEQD